MMVVPDNINRLILNIANLVESNKSHSADSKFWNDAGTDILIFIDETVTNSSQVNAMTPRDYSKENHCVLETMFIILDELENVNCPFQNDVWNNHIRKLNDEIHLTDKLEENKISFYELAFSRCCAYITQLLGDRFTYVQKLLIKYLFGSSNVCSLFASDLYMFVLRIIHPHQKMAMCVIIMNMCRSAPREALVKGAALINRAKHPIINFENPKYQYLLDFS